MKKKFIKPEAKAMAMQTENTILAGSGDVPANALQKGGVFGSGVPTVAE